MSLVNFIHINMSATEDIPSSTENETGGSQSPVTQANKRPKLAEASPKTGHISISEEALRNILDERLDAKLKVLDVTNNMVENLTMKVDNMGLKCAHLEHEIITQDMTITQLREDNDNLKQKMLQMELYSRRDNLVLHGIPEKRFENPEATVLMLLYGAGMDLESRAIVRAHRLGKFVQGRYRPLIIRFHHFTS